MSLGEQNGRSFLTDYVSGRQGKSGGPHRILPESRVVCNRPGAAVGKGGRRRVRRRARIAPDRLNKLFCSRERRHKRSLSDSARLSFLLSRSRINFLMSSGLV